MTNRILAVIVFTLFFACKPDPTSGLVDVDLMSYGVPIKIKAPQDAEVVAKDMIVMKDVTIKKDGFYVQLLYSDAITHDPVKALIEQRNTVESGPFFSKIVQEDEHGFIFEKKIDEDNINYDFRFIKIRGGKEYIFQTGLIGKHSLEEVQKMYAAVQ